MAIRVRSTAAACLAACLAGCGVGDYEARMLEAQNRIARTEENNRLLELGSIEMPIYVDEKGASYQDLQIFLRPPKGIGTKASNPGAPRVRFFTTFRPPQQGTAGPFAYLEIASALKTEADFRKEVLATFPTSGQAKTRNRTVTPHGRPALTFATYEFEDASYAYSVNFLDGFNHQAAIVYWFGRSGKVLAARAIEASLASCGIDGDAAPLRAVPPPPFAVPPK